MPRHADVLPRSRKMPPSQNDSQPAGTMAGSGVHMLEKNHHQPGRDVSDAGVDGLPGTRWLLHGGEENAFPFKGASLIWWFEGYWKAREKEACRVSSRGQSQCVEPVNDQRLGSLGPPRQEPKGGGRHVPGILQRDGGKDERDRVGPVSN